MNEDFFRTLDLIPNQRNAAFVDVEMSETAKGYKFDGIAAPVGESADLGDFTEEYARGVFRKLLSGSSANVPFLHEHNPRDLMATTRSGRLRLSEEIKGLRAQADVVKTDLSARVKALVDSGDIRGMSVGMVVGRGNSRVEMRGGRPHRTIVGLKKLLDVCTTFDPAYASTEAQFRSLAMQAADSPESLQRILMGAYPQLVDLGDETPAGDDETADEPVAHTGADDDAAEAQRRLEAAKRRMSFLTLTDGGPDYAS